MSLRLSSLQLCCGAAALVAGVYLGGSAQAAGRERGRSIEFSQPRSDEITTNLYQLRSKKDSLKQLEEDLNAPLQSFTPKSSLEGVVAPPPRAPAQSAVQSKRAKELLERRKNWVFMTPEDLLSGPTVEQILKSPEYGADGQKKEDLPLMERYYQHLLSKRSLKNSPGQTHTDELFNSPSKSSLSEASTRDEAELPAGIQERADAIRTMFQSDDSSSPFFKSSTAGGLPDPFKSARKAPTREQSVEHKKLMDEYHSLLDPSWRAPVAANSGVSSLGGGDAAPAARKPAYELPAAPSPSPRRGLEAQWDIRNPLLGPAGLPDVNARALGQTRPAPALPKTQEARTASSTPAYVAPKRAF